VNTASGQEFLFQHGSLFLQQWPHAISSFLIEVKISNVVQGTSKKIFLHWKKSNKIFLIYKEIQSGVVAKSYMRRGFLIYEKCANI
jgi:hypothetical protein